MKKVILVTDGACSGNPGPGGWAALLKYQDSSSADKIHEKLISGHVAHTTNNRMELQAVVEGLDCLKSPCLVTIVTDSQYVMKAFTDGWLEKWQANDWKSANKGPVKNRDLWEILLEKIEKHTVSWEWVRGHNGHPDNERVDEAARAAVKSDT